MFLSVFPMLNPELKNYFECCMCMCVCFVYFVHGGKGMYVIHGPEPYHILNDFFKVWDNKTFEGLKRPLFICYCFNQNENCPVKEKKKHFFQ